MRKSVVIYRSGNAIVVDPTTKAIHSLLDPVLTYQSKKYKPGLRGISKGSWDVNDIELYETDHRGRIATTLGMLEIIGNVLTDNGYSVRVKDLSKLRQKRRDRLETRWENLLDVAELRYRQDEFLLKMLSHDNGRFDCPPGFGKSKSVAFLSLLLPRAKILVTTKTVVVAKNTLYPELVSVVPDVGLVCAGHRHNSSHRVIVCTLDSLHHISPEWPDIVIHDENHQAGADKTAAKLARFHNSFMYGLSGTQNKRTDGGDALTQALYGPIRFHMPFDEALAHGLVGDVEVFFRDVIMDMNPCSGVRDVDRKKMGLWRNEYRNRLIVEDAYRYRKEQVLITCQTLEHVIRLHHICDEIIMLYHPKRMEETKNWYYNRGLLGRNVRLLNLVSKEKLIRRMERGEPGIYASTPILNVGFSPKKLVGLVRADAGASGIADTQIPGRLTRTNEFKSGGRLHDYLDQFDMGFRRMAKTRIMHYEENCWKIRLPKKASRFAQHFGFDAEE